ncbi:MAG: S-adenosylmethionine-dependent methyltransferase [Spirochaetaceae bacterium]|nr:MAG: S-adenosylmethionine-dependent methyltransferase [Spirochaetaceae bacterium]
MNRKTFSLFQIGKVRASENGFSIEVAPKFRKALLKLDQFSHAQVVWWADKHDNEESRATVQTKIPYADNLVTGVFACRSEYRPNPVALSVCHILSVDVEAGIVQVPYIDAFDGSPLLDIKAYFPVTDRVRDVRVPAWIKNWPEWYEDAYKLEKMFAEMNK